MTWLEIEVYCLQHQWRDGRQENNGVNQILLWR